MKSYNTQRLYTRMKEKGIQTSRAYSKTFENYSYYQLINAYKSLFVSKVFTILEIKQSVLNDIDIHEFIRQFNLDYMKTRPRQDIYEKILRDIAKKYSYETKNASIASLETMIKEHKYLLHIYNPNTHLEDFVRMYQFEHSQRNLLLKYVLRIEEDIKTIVTNTLNNEGKRPNFLLDIDNYNLKEKRSIESLIKVLKKNQNENSNPIQRKKEQNLVPPFWVLINELTLGELIMVIRNFTNDIKTKILLNLTSHFTQHQTPNVKEANKFLSLLNDIGVFRNQLAHNNPIYCYNVDGTSLQNYPLIHYTNPLIKDFKKLSPQQVVVEKNNRKRDILKSMRLYFGVDSYNTQSESSMNINLSYIIYVVFQMNKKIDPKTHFSLNLRKLYTKYGIYSCSDTGYTEDYSSFVKAYQNIELASKELNSINPLLKIKGNDIDILRQNIRDTKKKIESIRSALLTEIQHISIKGDDPLYTTFKFQRRYFNYTGIDMNYLTNILK